MRYGLSRADIGISAGDEQVLRAAARARAPWVLHHTDVAFTCDGHAAHFGRCMATVHHRLRAEHAGFLAEDPLMGAFLSGFASHRPYAANAALACDTARTAQIAGLIRRYRPAITSIGGDYLDALLALGRPEAARAALAPVLEVCAWAESVPVLTTYLAGIVSLDEVGSDLPGLMVPLNAPGVAMPPSRAVVLNSLARLGKPILAMHTLAAGRSSPVAALEDAFSQDNVVAAVVGATSPDHIDALLDAAERVFGTNQIINNT